MARWVGKTELAKLAGVTKAAITKAAVQAFPLAVEGHRVDLDHEQTAFYLRRRGIDPTRVGPGVENPAEPPTPVRRALALTASVAPSPAQPAPAPAPPPRAVASSMPPPAPPDEGDDERDPLHATEADIGRYLDWTLRRLLKRFGTSFAFAKWLQACKHVVEIEEKQLRVAEQTGKLISREFVRLHVFAHIDLAYTRLLQDTAATIARRLHPMARAGATLEECEAEARGLIGSQLATMKEATTRALRGGEASGKAA